MGITSMPGVGFMVWVVGLGSKNPEFKSRVTVELIPGVTRDWTSPSEESMLHVVAPLWTRHYFVIIDYLWEFNVNLFHISELSCPRGCRFYTSAEKSLVFLTSECSASS